jgi:hypothetical protein
VDVSGEPKWLNTKGAEREYLRKFTRGYIQKFPDWVDKEINSNENKHSLRSNTKGYGGKTH